MRRTGERKTIHGTDGAKLIRELKREASDHEVLKTRYSAFFNTQLESLVDEIKPDELIIAGINSHACVRMTAIDAYQRDYTVVLARDCIGSYDAEHHDMTLRYLSKAIAQIQSNAEILSNPRTK
jgi:isochorismate hydrolase